MKNYEIGRNDVDRCKDARPIANDYDQFTIDRIIPALPVDVARLCLSVRRPCGSVCVCSSVSWVSVIVCLFVV